MTTTSSTGRRPARGVPRPDPATARQLAAVTRVVDHVARFRLVLVALAGALAGGLTLAHPAPQVPYDFERFFRPAGLALLHGHLGVVFSNPQIQSGPLQLAWLAGVWRAAIEVGLPGLITLGAVTGAALAVAVAGVCSAALRDADPRLRARAVLAAGLFVAVCGPVAGAVHSGHPAEMVGALAWVGVVVLAGRGRPGAAGLLLAAACGFEVWPVLGLPLLLAAGWRGAARGAAAFAGGVAVLFGPFLAAGPFRMFGKHWLVMPGSLEQLLAPHTLFFTWPMRLVQSVLVVAVAAAVTLRLRHRPSLVWAGPLAVAAVRLLGDPLLSDYYFGELQVLAALTVALCVGGRRPGAWWVCAAAVLLPLATVFPPRLATVAVLAVAAVLPAVRRPGGTGSRAGAGHA